MWTWNRMADWRSAGSRWPSGTGTAVTRIAGRPIGTASRRYLTDDLGQVGADGLISVEGRADDVVQVAGASVSLGAVRSVLEADPRVIAAEVVAIAGSGMGLPSRGCGRSL